MQNPPRNTINWLGEIFLCAAMLRDASHHALQSRRYKWKRMKENEKKYVKNVIEVVFIQFILNNII